jgi:hypothetical protein
MKLIPSFLAKHLPVSRKAHQAALAKSHHQSEMDNAWLLSQLRQVTAANVRMERKLHLNASEE